MTGWTPNHLKMDLPLNMVIFQPVMLPCRGGEPSDLQLVGIKFGHGLKLCSEHSTRRGPLTTISGFIPSYTHLQPWLNRV